MTIAAIGRAFPEHCYDQAAIAAFLQELWSEHDAVVKRLPALFANTRVSRRYLALPLRAYAALDTFGRKNDAWIETAAVLGERAIDDALARAGLQRDDIDAIYTVSVTGIANPSLDARLVNRMGLRTDVKRLPIFGLGCIAGVAGTARAAEYVRAFPDQVAVLLSVELCSLTYQRDDASMANVVSTGLFGDGAAAALLVGENRARRLDAPGPAVRATRSVLYPDTEEVAGWRISERGFEIVLDASVPDIVRDRLGADVRGFLADLGVDRERVRSWVCHPGGPRVLRAMQDALALDDADVALSWKVLAEQGNLSSASVLMVLREVLDGPPARAGDLGMLLAMGPGFCAELVLLEW